MWNCLQLSLQRGPNLTSLVSHTIGSIPDYVFNILVTWQCVTQMMILTQFLNYWWTNHLVNCPDVPNHTDASKHIDVWYKWLVITFDPDVLVLISCTCCYESYFSNCCGMSTKKSTCFLSFPSLTSKLGKWSQETHKDLKG